MGWKGNCTGMLAMDAEELWPHLCHHGKLAFAVHSRCRFPSLTSTAKCDWSHQIQGENICGGGNTWNSWIFTWKKNTVDMWLWSLTENRTGQSCSSNPFHQYWPRLLIYACCCIMASWYSTWWLVAKINNGPCLPWNVNKHHKTVVFQRFCNHFGECGAETWLSSLSYITWKACKVS